MRNVISAKIAREASMSRLLKPSKVNTEAVFSRRSQIAKDWVMGISKPDTRPPKLVSSTVRGFAEEKRIQHAQKLAMQGCWTKWHDRVIPFDLSWKNVIYGQGTHVIKFVLNATVNWVKIPDLLKLWGYSEQAHCKLCGHPQCTLHPIISNCDHSLKG